MPDFHRDLQIRADGRTIAQGCRAALTAHSALSLRPIPKMIEIYDLSDSSAAFLAGAARMEILSGLSVLAQGEIIDVFTRIASGKRITSVTFAPGLSLWQSVVSLAVFSGMKVSETIRSLLTASRTDIPLAAFAADDPVLTRPQCFFGRTCDALSLLAETAEADIFLAPAGVCVSARTRREVSGIIPEKDLLSEPIWIGPRLLLTTSMIGWLPGSCVRTTWKGTAFTGRIVSILIQADNVSSPWKAELELEM